ncbi:MAG: hypothetical protein LBQ08_02035 [Holosporaceae bacterium]|jgi:3-hydroxymyristoyl/3-hydroxydecanoyl-(acyl carrier protein) dehydratase|nr:hypothetical protein [Holosporaceae bacterium]
MCVQCSIISENFVKTADKLELTLLFHESAIFFRGHFENFPVLPGVVQLHYVVRFIEEYFYGNISVKSLGKVKFLKMIFPGRQVFLKLIKNDKTRFSFLFEAENRETCSSGEILLDCADHEIC